MSEQHSKVDQLWYTWSDVGLNTIRAGFRIRAASEGLQDMRSERVQHLDRYQRYSLPQEADPAIPPNIAPICLSLLNTGQERILVHKEYTGKDAIGRYGVFFVHLLAGLPEDFSARDAISLWRAPFWKTSDASREDHYDTHLDRVSLPDELQTVEKEKKEKQLSISGQHSEKIREYLPYIIQVYLRKKPLYEYGQTRPRPLYIIAPDDDVAYLISGLTQCLPKRLLKDLTFSTYEHDIFEATTEIVGTCWLSESVTQKMPLLERLFPSWYSQEFLALNCYTNTRSPLENNSFLENRPLAAAFATAATDYFLHDDKEFKGFLDKDAEDCPDVDSLLRLFQSLIVSSQNPSDEEIALALRPQTEEEYRESAKVLSKLGYQQGIIRRTKYESGWWKQFEADISNLRQRAAIMPDLMLALLSMANTAATDIVNMAHEKKAQLLKDVPTEVEAFWNLTNLIYSLAPPNVERDLWISLLLKILAIKNIPSFINKHWNIYTTFVTIACNLFIVLEENSSLLAPLLMLSWGALGAFLDLPLPLEWKKIAARTLVSPNSPTLDRVIATTLGKDYARPIEAFFTAVFSDAEYWETLLSLFDQLTKASYPEKMSLLSSLFNAGIGEGEYLDYAVRLLDTAHLTVDEQIQFLILYGPDYLPLNNRMSLVILDIMSDLSKRDASAKMRVLSTWLSSPPLPTWFCSSRLGESSLTSVLKKADLNPRESGAVLQLYNQMYIRCYPQSRILLDLFERWARKMEERQSLRNILNIWLSLPLEQETLERLLIAVNLTDDEQISFLLHHGLRYLKSFPQSQIFRTYTKTFYAYLWSIDIHLLEQPDASRHPSYWEQLLNVLRSTPQAYGNMWEVWYTIAFFVRDPSLLQREAQKVARYANLLLSEYEKRQQIGRCTKLLQLLASACIEKKDMLEHLVDVFSSEFTQSNLMLLLYEIAVCAQESIQTQQQEKALFVPCIACGYKFKNRFLEKEEQVHFLELFLNTLLSYTDKKVRQRINDEIGRQHPEIAARWRKYIIDFQYPLSPAVARTSLICRYLLWREENMAMPLLMPGRRKTARLAQINVEYMTTLNRTLTDEWRSKIDTASLKLKALEDIIWQQSPIVAPLLTIPAKDIIPQQSAVAVNNLSVLKKVVSTPPGIVQKLFWFNRPRVPWQSIIRFNDKRATKAFKEVRRALRSEHIGRIVRVATDYMIVLEAYYKDVPDTWWRMLDAAFSFLTACENTSIDDPLQEQAIITASEKIMLLVDAHQPAPILTEHERQRVKAAVQFIANTNVQKAKDADRQWIRETLSLAHMPGMEPTVQLYPHKASSETAGFSRYLPNWLARLFSRQ